jgi:hypothetical protein
MLRQGTWAAFHRNGVIDNYRLAEDTFIEGMQYGKGDILLFDEEGRISERVNPFPARPFVPLPPLF